MYIVYMSFTQISDGEYVGVINACFVALFSYHSYVQNCFLFIQIKKNDIRFTLVKIIGNNL